MGCSSFFVVFYKNYRGRGPKHNPLKMLKLAILCTIAPENRCPVSRRHNGQYKKGDLKASGRIEIVNSMWKTVYDENLIGV